MNQKCRREEEEKLFVKKKEVKQQTHMDVKKNMNK